jgi:hypothetical protein
MFRTQKGIGDRNSPPDEPILYILSPLPSGHIQLVTAKLAVATG